MNTEVLFDTSVWIDFFRGIENSQVELLSQLLENNQQVYVCPVILQEVLQGIRSERQYKDVKESMLSLEMLVLDSVQAAIGAADIYRKLRKKGISIRKSNDCLIAFYAQRFSLTIIHKDRDFDKIQTGLDS